MVAVNVNAAAPRTNVAHPPADNTSVKFTGEVMRFIVDHFPTEKAIDPWELKGKQLKGLPATVKQAHEQNVAKLGANKNNGRAASVYKFSLPDGVAYAARYQVIDDARLPDSDELRLFSASGKKLAVGTAGPSGELTFTTGSRATAKIWKP